MRNADLPYFEMKTCGQGFEYKKHTHNEFSLGIVEKGHTRFFVNGSTSIIGPGSIVFIPPQVVHSCTPGKQDEWCYKMLFMQAEWFHSVTGQHAALQTLFQAAGFLDRKLFSATQSMLNSLFIAGNPLEQETRIIDYLGRLAQNEPDLRSEALHCPALAMKRAREYISENFKEKIKLDDLVATTGISKYHLIRYFQQVYFLPPHTLQTVLRVNYAKRELAKGQRIIDIALETGFADQSHFTRTFKKYVGTTPEVYQLSAR